MKPIKLFAAALILTAAVSCNQPQNSPQTTTYDNAVVENIMTRRSIRKYTDQPVSRDVINKIMECGINAPNGQNKQSWEVRIVDNPATMEKIKEIMAKGNPTMKPEAVKGCFRDAPVMAFIARDPEYPFSAYDCGLLSANIMLSAWSYGVGSICLGMPVRFIAGNEACKPVLDILGFSEGYEFCLCVGLGYPDEAPAAKPRDMGKVKFIE